MQHRIEGVGDVDAEDLLALLDAENVHEVGSEELGFSCLYVPGHVNGDRNPSCHINRESLLWRCLAGETKVITSHGRVPIKRLVGKSITILTRGGEWRKTKFYALGEQRLWCITLSRNGIKHVVRATGEHRWFLETRKLTRQERTTSELQAGDTLEAIYPSRTPAITGLHVSMSGVMHGFTYGDGTLESYDGHRGYGSRAYLFPPKDEAMIPWFGMHKMLTRKDDGRVIVFGLPRSYRSLPKLSEGAAYLYGWLAGYFAVDGTVSVDGLIELDSASYESLEHAQTICDMLGVGTSTIRTCERDGHLERINASGTDCDVRPIHRMRISGITVTPEFFLLPHHRERYVAAGVKAYECMRWTVVSAEQTDDVEEVYCCEVPGTESFALDGNILTGNCKGCGRAGNLLELVRIGLPQRPSFPETMAWLREHFGEVVRKPRGGSLTADLTARLQSARERLDIPQRRLPNEAETIGPQGIFALDWSSGHEAAVYMRDVRGFAPEVLEDWGLGYDTWTGRVAIPVRDADGVLVGFKGRALRDGAVKYLLLGDTEDRQPRYGTGYGFDMHDHRTVLFGVDRAIRFIETAGVPAELQPWDASALQGDGTSGTGQPDARDVRPREQSSAPRSKRVALVEGELDAVACHAAGVPAVAPGTTSITTEQLWLMRAHFDEVVLFYDADKAGEDAVWGSVDAESGRWRPGWVEKISPYFTLLVCDDHEGDPASMAPEQVRSLVAGARHWLRFAIPSEAPV